MITTISAETESGAQEPRFFILRRHCTGLLASCDVLQRTRSLRRALERRPIVRLVRLCLLAVRALVPASLLTGYRRFLFPFQKQSSVPSPPSLATPCRYQ